MTKDNTFYVYCDENGNPYRSPKIGKGTLYYKKPTPHQLAMMRYFTDGVVCNIREFKLVEVSEPLQK